MTWFMDNTSDARARYQQASAAEKRAFLKVPVSLTLVRLLAEDPDPDVRANAQQRFQDELVEGPGNWTYRWVINTATSGDIGALSTLLGFEALFPVSEGLVRATDIACQVRPWKPIESSGARVATHSLKAFSLFFERVARHHDPELLTKLQAGRWAEVEARSVRCYEDVLQRVLNNPAWPEASGALVDEMVGWWMRLPGDRRARASRLALAPGRNTVLAIRALMAAQPDSAPSPAPEDRQSFGRQATEWAFFRTLGEHDAELFLSERLDQIPEVLDKGSSDLETAARGAARSLRTLMDNPVLFPTDGSTHPTLYHPWCVMTGFAGRLDAQSAEQFNAVVWQHVWLHAPEVFDLLHQERWAEAETVVVRFYELLFRLMMANPSWRKMKQDDVNRSVEWWLRLPGDALLRSEWLLLQAHRPGIVALASTWATPGPVLSRVLAWATMHDDVELRRGLIYNHRLPQDAQARLWADPDVRVRATALESLIPPSEVLLRLVHDPQIQRQHFRSQADLGYMAGSPIFSNQPELEQEFLRVLMDRFGLGVGWYVH